MPHLRSRHIHEAFNQLCAHSAIVGVFGHRQVGKTTFLESLLANYRTLDDEKELKKAHEDSRGSLYSCSNSDRAWGFRRSSAGILSADHPRNQGGDFKLSESL